MRRILASVIVFLLCGTVACAEDAAAERTKGIQALKQSQSSPHEIVVAARCFAKASEIYAKAGDDGKAAEMNSFLFWCKKKMTYQDIEQFTKGGDASVAEKLYLVEKISPEVTEAQAWFDRAEKFASENPAEHFLIAVRFFEVASRFAGTKPSLAAQQRSLSEQALAQEKAPAAEKPHPASVADKTPAPDKLNPAENADPIRKRLNTAKATLNGEVENARKALLDSLDKREADARKAGNKKAVDQVKEERAAFDAKKQGEQISLFPPEAKRKIAAAWKALSAEYEATIKEYTKAAKDDDANAVEKEFKLAADDFGGVLATPARVANEPPPAAEILRDKTLVAWITIGNVTQRRGSVLSLNDPQDHFDGIVFAEVEPAKWMAGSDTLVRTQKDQKLSPPESSAPTAPIQIAISYHGREITIYHNARKYAQYRVATDSQPFGIDTVALLGVRSISNGGDCFVGTVSDARIYSEALNDVQLASLHPGVAAGKPWAWFTFEDGTCRDHAGRFAEGKLVNGAAIKGGVLVLNGKGYVKAEQIGRKK